MRWDQQGGQCHYCTIKMSRRGNEIHRATIDHIRPKSTGGTNEPSNLILCCRACNEAKGNMGLKRWDKILAARRLP